MRSLAFALVVPLLAACGGSESPVTGAKPEPRDLPARATVAGAVEKGPFADGTVAIAPAGGGAAVTTSIQDGLGHYLALVPVTPVYELVAAGRPYRETAGAVAAAPLALRALHAGEGTTETIHVNVLTELAHDRAARLAAAGTSWADAIARADGEVHRALGVGVPFFTPDRPASTFAMLGADDRDHAYLFAAAAVVDRAAGEDLAGFLSALDADLADDGALSDELAARVAEARHDVDAPRVTAALRAWLDRTGHADVAIPDLRRILDADGDGSPDREDTLAVDPSRLAIVRHGLDRADEATGGAGAIAAACPPSSVELFDRQDGPGPIAAGPVANDGSFALAFGTAESSRPRLWLEATDACGGRTARVALEAGVDVEPPALAPEAFAIVRRGGEAPDGVRATAGAVSDAGAIAEVWFAPGPGADRIAGAVPAADGGLAEIPIGTADASYPSVWAEAVDKAGNVSGWVEIPEGSAPDLPAVDPARVTVLRRGIGAIDAAFGAPGALSGTCRPVAARLADTDAAGALPVAVAPVDADGAFPETAFGTASATPARIWLVPVDKCGRAGPATELVAARDEEPPAIDPARLVLRAGLHDNGALGLPGAVLDANGVAALSLREADCGAEVGRVVPAADGSFPAGTLAGFTSSEARFCVEARDKAGNVSPPVKSRRVAATLDAQSAAFGGRPEVAVFSNAFDGDPRTESPGYAAWASSRLDEAARAALAQGGVGLSTQAEAETRDVPAAWRWFDLSTPGDVAVAAGSWGPTLAIRSAGDWPWMVTLEGTCTTPCASYFWRVAAIDGPPRREGMAAAGHSGAVYAFGGTGGTTRFSDTWRYDGTGRWTRLDGAGGPAAVAVRMVEDPVLAQPLLVAAVEGDPALQVWRLDDVDGATWTWTRLVAPGGPSFRTGFGLAADLGRGDVVLFGGRDAGGTALGDTWLWDGSSWSMVALATSPSPRWGHGMAYWLPGDAVVLRGGSVAGALDSWSWDGVRWSHLDIDGRTNGEGVAVVADAYADRFFTFHASQPVGAPSPVWTVHVEDPLGQGADEFLGPPAGGGALAWDPDLRSTTWKAAVELPLDGAPGMWWRWEDGRWWRATGDEFPAGTRTLVVDTHRGLRLDLGRNDDGRGVATDERGNRVVFDLPAWPAGVAPVYVYDALAARTIGVGGGESWAIGAPDFLAGTAPLAPLSGGPAGPGPVELVFDPHRGRAVAYDGDGTWELVGDAWVPTAAAPAACPGGHLLFDPEAGRVLKLAGGGCPLECWYDGAWTCGGVQAPEADLVGAPDPARGVLLARGAGARTWIRDGATPHLRFAVQTVSVGLPPGAIPLGANGTLTASPMGSGNRFELLAWNSSDATWTSLGTTETRGLTVTMEGSLPADPAPYLRDGRLWLEAVAGTETMFGTSWSRLRTTRWEIAVEYLLP
jgi:hypothetical protein